MGFTTGLLGGVTLTTTVLYLSLAIHNQTRLRQAALLQSQTQVIDAVTSPHTLLAPPPDRVVRAGLLESAKDKWNAQLEHEVRMLQNIDWHGVWDRVEENISLVYRKAFEKGREVVPDPPKKP